MARGNPSCAPLVHVAHQFHRLISESSCPALLRSHGDTRFEVGRAGVVPPATRGLFSRPVVGLFPSLEIRRAGNVNMLRFQGSVEGLVEDVLRDFAFIW